MGFTQKGFSSHTGTSGHRSALKAHTAGHKPEMSKTTKHGQIGDAKADFKADQEAYKKAMADKTKTKSMETLHEEGFSPNDALRMQKDGAVTGEQDTPPTKFLGLGDKEGRAKRKTMRKDAKTKRKASKKVTKSENKKIKSDGKTAKLASKLNKRQVKAETNITEKKENKAKKGSKFKGNLKDGIGKVNNFLYGDKDKKEGSKLKVNKDLMKGAKTPKGKAETGGTNAEIAKNNKDGKRAIRNYKFNKAVHDLGEGEQAFTKGRRMKEFDGEDPRNKLASKQNQNKGIKSGNESKSKTSKSAEFKTDGKYDTAKDNMAKTQTKMDNKAAEKLSKKTKKSLESNPLYKQNKGVKKGGGSYDKYFG